MQCTALKPSSCGVLCCLRYRLHSASNWSRVFTASAEFNSIPDLLVFLFLILLRTVTKEKRPLEPTAHRASLTLQFPDVFCKGVPWGSVSTYLCKGVPRGNASTYLHVRVGEATGRQVVCVHSDRLLLSSHVLIFVKCQWIHGTLIIQTPGTEDRGTKGWHGRTGGMHPFSFVLTLQTFFFQQHLH